MANMSGRVTLTAGILHAVGQAKLGLVDVTAPMAMELKLPHTRFRRLSPGQSHQGTG
jgi:hypothetical protein